MPRHCSVHGCQSNYAPGKQNKSEPIATFGFPLKNFELLEKWIKFVNREEWEPTKNSAICVKHFEKRYYKNMGNKTILLYELNPIPTVQCDEFTLEISEINDEMKMFRKSDKIKDFTCINKSICPVDFSFSDYSDYKVFYKLDTNHHGIPEITESIKIDKQLHVKLYFKGLPVPLPEWFRQGNNVSCVLTSKSMLDNFPSYIKTVIAPTFTNILDELRELRYYKSKGRPPYSAELVRYALYLRYTSRNFI